MVSISHKIGIFDNLRNLLTFATVSSGTGDSLLNPFRYVPISDIMLLPGDYTIGAFFSQGDADLALAQAETFAGNAGINFGGAAKHSEALHRQRTQSMMQPPGFLIQISH
jgi:hypothetical protein